MPKAPPEQKLTKQDVENFLRQVEDSREYEDPQCRETIDKISQQIKSYISSQGDLENTIGLSLIGKKIDEIATAILKAKYGPKIATGELAPDVVELIGTLSADYLKATENLAWYGILESAEDGKRFYTADYDGSSELDGKGENFTGKKITIPEFSEVIGWLTPANAALYREYKEKGLEPRLQLTPLALKLRTLAGKLDAKKAEINARAGSELIKKDTFIWDKKETGEIDESQLCYEPEQFEASEDGKSLTVGNGLTKSELINKYNGWLVQIVPMKQDLDADPDKISKEITKDGKAKKIELINAEKSALYMKEARGRGESGMGYEDDLIAQMNSLAGAPPKPLEKDYWTILPESTFTKKEIVAGGFWCDDRVDLGGGGSSSQFRNLRCRRSVRLLRP